MEEILEVVDKDDRVIGRAPRSECHKNPKLIHRAAGTLVFNDKGEILMQKRNISKDTDPGKWDISSCGHLDIGESYEHAAARELKEELGISAGLKLLFKSTYSVSYETEVFCIYVAKHNGPFKPDAGEVSEVRFYNLEELKKELKENPKKFTEYCHVVMREYFRRFKGISFRF